MEVHTEEVLLDQHGLRPAAADDVGGFLRLEPGIDRNEYTARGEQPECRDHPLRGVRRPDGYPLALVDAEFGECACGVADPVNDLGEGETQRTGDDSFRVAETVRRAQDHLGDGLPSLTADHTVTRRPRLPPMIFA